MAREFAVWQEKIKQQEVKYRIEMCFHRIIGCCWIALCTVGLVSRCVTGAEASKEGKERMVGS